MTMSYQPGDEVNIGGATITLGRRKGNNGYRWSWHVPSTDLSGEAYWPTPEQAIADARKAMAEGECRHGQRPSACLDCLDAR